MVWNEKMKLNNGYRRVEGTSNKSFLLVKENRTFSLFQKVQGAMLHVPDFAKTCTAILDAVIEETDAENCSLMLKDSASGDLIVRSARGKAEEKGVFYPNSPENGKRFKSEEGIAGKVFKEGQGVMLNDANNAPNFLKTHGGSEKINSLICFPVRENDQVVGVFNVSHSQKGAFHEGDKTVLSFISNQVGLALTSSRFFLENKEIQRLMENSKETPSGAASAYELGGINSENGMFICVSEKMHQIKELIDQVANTDVTVLIQGESGVGKEVIARSIHSHSSRRERPFIKVNCAAIPPELLESELFGYEKGAFTGAYRQKPGKFELAHTGTIFLDEISEMSLSLQGKILQVLQDREFSKLGGKKDIWVDVRILAATNRNIEEMVNHSQFREDLYYRLNVVNITLPPLRERSEEIPVFIEYFLDKFSKKYRKKVNPLSSKIMKIFKEHHWPGNVRELENVLQRYVILEKEKMIMDELTHGSIENGAVEKEKSLAGNFKTWPSLKEVYREATLKAESETILKALQITNWNKKRAAQMLNISYKALLYKIKDSDLERSISQ
jgi:transcriptional regulator with GAF, ATPase, and Fis domain